MAGKFLMGRQTWLSVLGPVERCVYHMAGVDPPRNGLEKVSDGRSLFNAAGFLVLFLFLLCQMAALNPAERKICGGIYLNTAISFVTNTNWQSTGEGPEGVVILFK
ncbi:MAG: potassium-transporting ATPase subunit KdpA [Akkermansia sp.]